MNDIVYNSLYMLYEIPQILYDVMYILHKNPDIVKNLTISQKLQNGYNVNIFPNNWHYLVNKSYKIVTKGGYISDK